MTYGIVFLGAGVVVVFAGTAVARSAGQHQSASGRPAAACRALVLGTHGRSAIAPMLTGSLAAGVVRRATCDVPVARPAAHRYQTPWGPHARPGRASTLGPMEPAPPDRPNDHYRIALTGGPGGSVARFAPR